MIVAAKKYLDWQIRRSRHDEQHTELNALVSTRVGSAAYKQTHRAYC